MEGEEIHKVRLQNELQCATRSRRLSSLFTTDPFTAFSTPQFAPANTRRKADSQSVNPVYNPKDATSYIPIYLPSLAVQLGLEFVTRDKDMHILRRNASPKFLYHSRIGLLISTVGRKHCTYVVFPP